MSRKRRQRKQNPATSSCLGWVLAGTVIYLLYRKSRGLGADPVPPAKESFDDEWWRKESVEKPYSFPSPDPSPDPDYAPGGRVYGRDYWHSPEGLPQTPTPPPQPQSGETTQHDIETSRLMREMLAEARSAKQAPTESGGGPSKEDVVATVTRSVEDTPSASGKPSAAQASRKIADAAKALYGVRPRAGQAAALRGDTGLAIVERIERAKAASLSSRFPGVTGPSGELTNIGKTLLALEGNKSEQLKFINMVKKLNAQVSVEGPDGKPMQVSRIDYLSSTATKQAFELAKLEKEGGKNSPEYKRLLLEYGSVAGQLEGMNKSQAWVGRYEADAAKFIDTAKQKALENLTKDVFGATARAATTANIVEWAEWEKKRAADKAKAEALKKLVKSGWSPYGDKSFEDAMKQLPPDTSNVRAMLDAAAQAQRQLVTQMEDAIKRPSPATTIATGPSREGWADMFNANMVTYRRQAKKPSTPPTTSSSSSSS